MGGVGMQKNLLPMLVAVGALTALSMDIYFPAMDMIAEEFGRPDGQLQWTISAFMLSFSLGQLVYGPLSDRFGRRITLFIGLVIYAIANLGCAFASNLELLVLGRFLQGLGACAGSISCFAIARDLYNDSSLTKAIATIASMTSIAPILAPLIGAKLAVIWGWRSSFVFLIGVSVILVIWVWLGLPETRKEIQKENMTQLGRVYLSLLGHGTFMRYSLVNCFIFGGLFVFLSAGAPLLMGAWGASANTFAIYFGLNAGLYMIGSFLAGKLTEHLETQHIAQIGTGVAFFGGLIMWFLSNNHHLAAFLVPMGLVTLGVSWALPASTSGGLNPLGKRAGSASAFQGFLRFGGASIIAAILSTQTIDSAKFMSLLIAGCTFLSFVFAMSTSLPFKKVQPVRQSVEIGS